MVKYKKVVVTSVLSFRPLRAICGSAEGEISPKGRNDKGGRGKSSLVVMRHFSVLRGGPRACADFCDPTAVSRFNHLPIFSRVETRYETWGG